MPLSVVLVNVGRAPAAVTLAGAPNFDVTVTRPDGAVVWNRLPADVRFQDEAWLRTLRPGDTVVFRDNWRQRDTLGGRVPPGRYCVHGILFGGPSHMELRAMRAEPVPVVIEP